MFHALKNYYDINEEQAAELLHQLEIYHPYGTVGCLPWQRRKHSIDFGAEPTATQLLDLSKGIKTFTERTALPDGDIKAIRQRVCTANRLVFLGFAFHRLNLELLSPHSSDIGVRKASKCLATAKGISESDCLQIKSELERFSMNIHLRADLTCNELFREFWRTSSFAF